MDNKIIDLRRVIDYDFEPKSWTEHGMTFDAWTLFYKTGLKLDKVIEIKLKTYHKGTIKLKNTLRLDFNKRPLLRLNENLIINEGKL